MYARQLNNAARRPLQAGQTKPSGQRRLHKNAAHFASSVNACWNSVSERALAIEGPFAPPLAAAHQDTIFRGTWDNGISRLRKLLRCNKASMETH